MYRKELLFINELILNTSVLPDPLLHMVRTDKVRIREDNGVITMTPIEGTYDCTAEVFGMYSDGKLSVSKYLEQKHAEKELEF